MDDMRQHALRIFNAAVEAVDPEKAVLRHLKKRENALWIDEQRLDLADYDRILVVGAGKADAPMARAVEKVLGEDITGGSIVVKDGHGLPLNRITVHEAGHPVPDGRGVQGAEAILDTVRDAGERDLVICLLSGGGSALLVSPVEGVDLEDKQGVTRLLLSCGATIHEINAVRKHLSRVKGGRLAGLAHPATVVSLILSDVVGDDLDVIASGPTVPDRSTFGQAVDVLKGYKVWAQVPDAAKRHLKMGLAGDIEDTPKPGDPAFEKDCLALVGTNLQALKAAGEEAKALGYPSLILSSMIQGEAREVAKAFSAVPKEIIRSGLPVAAPACILCGGETTVTIKGAGKGGRNQEFALAAAFDIDGIDGVVALSGGSDGTDGPTDAAGAVADGATLTRARKLGLDPKAHLEENNAYPFFKELGDLIITGPTRTNVMDIYMMLVGKP